MQLLTTKLLFKADAVFPPALSTFRRGPSRTYLREEPSHDRAASTRATVTSHDCNRPVTNTRLSLKSTLNSCLCRKPEKDVQLSVLLQLLTESLRFLSSCSFCQTSAVFCCFMCSLSADSGVTAAEDTFPVVLLHNKSY